MTNFRKAVIKHYAFKGKETAQFTLDKFATIGFNTWIQSITGWKPALENDEPAIILPTPEELDFMRSRSWKRAELEGRRITPVETHACFPDSPTG